MWKNRTGHRRQYKTGHAQRMLCNKATDTHPEYVIPIYCFPRQKCLCKRASILRLYLYCLSCFPKWLTLRLLMSYIYIYVCIYIYIYIYIYMERLFLMFLDHTQRRSTVGRIPLDE